MANPVNAHGVRPLMRTLGGAPCRISEHAKPATDGSVIGMWDIVALVASSSASPTGYPAVPVRNVTSFSNSTPGTTLLLGSSLNYGKASTLTYQYVVDSIDALFESMVGVAAAFTIAADGGLNANVKNTATTALSHISAMYVDDTTLATTSTLDLKIVGGYDVPPNVEGLDMIVEVVINKHALGQGTAGV